MFAFALSSIRGNDYLGARNRLKLIGFKRRPCIWGLTGQSGPLKQEGSIFPVAALVRYVKWSHLCHRQYPGKLMQLPSNYL